ncbi:eukaryotic translation initiation factor 5-like [Agrilus planipennis]|uniref:Eukaryotic translation initiation factor 5 n=1 Tax=Agrilus planipennis TaxID=224129 RepID=A0A1W4X3Q3_AGRPL|nr:eukaryotic translation initiation factor 5 [Agrilus planipennis]XP_018327428.1 eukaryotic translation initiation factor 5 [Agrilus planipennis]XP_018327429.1 eukaryotic translation initiation factor 5 [Agrilus planipennis]XP_025835065.1 eukaryotic translation initiation factor 5-like [Agrilus planipennis]XP_025835066.1 eukaryotic translation initiation factor 5-like [Agrilus planipennis]XP_025835067.1 eukaryotic translation initiation factor 5-like [Agrilus planipennis]
MGSVNINRSVSDAFYRYKMPRIVAKVEGKGNGIKTVIVNMTEVAKALGRPPTYPTKYFGCELGAQTQFDFKNERFIVNGSHDAIKLQDLLDGFIRKFVLCPGCDNPETDLIVSAKRGTISTGCKACGYHGILKENHKLNTFILKNPPNMNPAVQGSSLTEGKRTKRSKKVNGDSQGTNNGDAQGDEEVGLEAPADLTFNDNTANDEDDGTEWAADISEEAVRARMQDLTEGAKNITITDDLEKSEKERLDMLYEMVKTKRDAGLLENSQAQKELVNEAERLEIKSKATLILAELLFNQNILQQVKKHHSLLLRFTHEDKKAQKYLMGGLEQVISMHRDTLMNKVPGLLKLFYDMDILTEPAIIEWADKVSKKYVSKDVSQEIHNKAAPFIKWLKEAEEEESSDSKDESDEGVEIEYNDRVQVSQMKAAPAPTSKTSKIPAGVDDDEDDVDIDAI